MLERLLRHSFLAILGISVAVASTAVSRQVAYGQEATDTRKTTLKLLQNRNGEPPRQSAFAFAASGEATVPTLIDALRDPNSDVRQQAALSLARIGPGAAKAAPALRDALNDPDSAVRLRAALALGAIGRAAVPALIDALGDQRTDVRRWAALALARIGRGATNAVPALRESLEDPDAGVRQRAVLALGAIGEAAVPTLIDASHDQRTDVRQWAALALARIGPGATDAVPALIEALQDQDAPAQVRQAAAGALGQIGSAAEPAVPALIGALRDRNAGVRGLAARTLGDIGKAAVPALRKASLYPTTGAPEASTTALGETGVASAVPALIDALGDSEQNVRQAAAAALGQIGSVAAAAMPALTDALTDQHLGSRIIIAQALEDIAGALQDVESTSTLPELRKARDVLTSLAMRVPEIEQHARNVTRAVAYLERAQWKTALADAAEFIEAHPYPFIIIFAYFFLIITWLLLFCWRPLAILRINDAIKPHQFTLPPWLGSMKVPLAHLLLVGFLAHQRRVLDAWVRAHIDSVRQRFAERDTVRDRKIHVDVPVILNGVPDVQLGSGRLRPVFSRHIGCLLIQGEGGAGKTSLACRIAEWAMADDASDRLCDHYMLPVLIEQDLEVPLRDAVGGQLQALADEPNPIATDLLEQLLRYRRVLVIVDHLSEMNAETRARICPGAADFPVNALIVTSRLEEQLGGINRSVIQPARLDGNGVSYFLEIYLTRRGARSLFDLDEYFEGCRRLAALARDRAITILLAKLYAERLIAIKRGGSEGDLPDTIPDLMLAYLNELNRDIPEVEKLDDRIVHHDAQALAWECLEETYRAGAARIEDARSALGGENPESRLKYLEDRLRLIRTLPPAKDHVRFLLDPLAEYLAGLNRVQAYGADGKAWSQFFTEADNKEGAPEAIQGFMLAVRDCCLAVGKKAEVPSFIERELVVRASLDSQALGAQAPLP